MRASNRPKAQYQRRREASIWKVGVASIWKVGGWTHLSSERGNPSMSTMVPGAAEAMAAESKSMVVCAGTILPSLIMPAIALPCEEGRATVGHGGQGQVS